MARKAAGAKKVLSEANLAALGAERLAAVLMETAGPSLKRRLRLELAAAVGAPDLAFELDKRLGTLDASKTRVSWRKRPELIAELQTLKSMIVERLAEMEPNLALDRLVAWFDLFPGVSRRVQDPKGEVALVFDSASNDLALLASRLGPEAAGPVLGEALSTRLSEWASWVGRGAASLSPELARRLLSDLTQGRPRASGRLALVVRKLADRAGDLDAWILAIPDPDRLKPEVGSEIARRLAEAGRAAEARAALDACRTTAPATRFGRGRADPPPPQPEIWCAAEIAVLDAEGRAADADEARWSAFERTLSDVTLRTLLAKLPDFEDVIALDRAFEIASSHADPMRGLGFLMNWPAYREAAAMVMARRTQLRGGHDDVPLWAGRLATRFPAAALVLLRARAAALVRLGSEFNEEVQGLIGEAEALAAQVPETDVPGHAAFLAELRPPALRRPAWR